MKSTNEILKRIREVCGLEKLEFGCEVIWTSPASEENKQKSKQYKAVVIRNWKNGAVSILENFHVNVTQSTHTILESDIEIIGLPVEHGHLTQVVNGCVIFYKGKIDISPDIGEINYRGDYNLSLTVEQNLNQNDELRAFISELIFK